MGRFLTEARGVARARWMKVEASLLSERALIVFIEMGQMVREISESMRVFARRTCGKML